MTALSDLITPTRLSYPFGEPPEGADVLWRVDAKSYSYVVDAERELYGVTAPRLEMTWWRAGPAAVRAWIGASLSSLTTKFHGVDGLAARRLKHWHRTSLGGNGRSPSLKDSSATQSKSSL